MKKSIEQHCVELRAAWLELLSEVSKPLHKIVDWIIEVCYE